MGFNNGYDSGYEDAKAEFAAEKAVLEKRIKELESSAGPGGGSGGEASPVPVFSLSVSPETAIQLLAPDTDPVYDTSVVPVHRLSPAIGEYSGDYAFGFDSGNISGTKVVIVPSDLGDVYISMIGGGMYMDDGVYVFSRVEQYIMRVAGLDAIQNAPLAS